jgi:hypothetical protein
MTLKFWDEAFLTATYLINRMPSKVATSLINRMPSEAIHDQTPFKRLLYQPLEYSHLRVFCCACWQNMLLYNTRKLQFRFKQCVFLRYSIMHKSFKCLDVAIGHVYISRDVVFDETVFPFATLHPNAGVCICSEILLLPYTIKNPSSTSEVNDVADHSVIFPNLTTSEPMMQIQVLIQL